MTVDSVVLFPGHGAYLPGFLTHLFDHNSDVRAELAEIDAVASEYGHEPVSGLLIDPESPPADQLVRTDPARWDLVIYAGSIAAYALLRSAYDFSAAALMGHGMGEIAALAAAGAVSTINGARIICERAEVLHDTPLPPGGLITVGIAAARADALICALDVGSLCLAADDTPRQVALSGDEQALAAVQAVAAAAGWHSHRLRAPRLCHNDLLEHARRHFAERIAPIPVLPPRLAIYSPHHSRWYRADDPLLELMTAHLTLPVRFADAVRYLHAHSANLFIESGARGALCDLVAATVPGIGTAAPFRTRPQRQPIPALTVASNRSAQDYPSQVGRS